MLNKEIIGKRIRLLGKMLNPGSVWMPEENLPVGLEGTIEGFSIHNTKFDQIWVRWDNGSSLGVFPSSDDYEIF